MNLASLFPRRIEQRIAEALLDTPVVLLAGPRQAGKTTLVRQIAEQQGLRYLTLDDALTLLSAREDPVGMIRSLDRAVIDEIQRAPHLLLAIKKSVDEDRRPGRFLLTGSANLMALPTVADSLAGRMETLSLLPLSQSESMTAPRRCPWDLESGQRRCQVCGERRSKVLCRAWPSRLAVTCGDGAGLVARVAKATVHRAPECWR